MAHRSNDVALAPAPWHRNVRTCMWRARLGFCLALAAAGVYVRAQAPAPVSDELFKEPYVDVDVWRDTPVRHRYVHGGFKGTDTRFSIYLPPREQYRRRFFQHITPVPDNENLAQKVPAGEYNKIGFSIASGAYFLETNGGGHLDLGKAASAGVTGFAGGRRDFVRNRALPAFKISEVSQTSSSGVSAGNGGQCATAKTAFTALAAMWFLQVADSKESCRVRIPPSPPITPPPSRRQPLII